VRLDDDDRRPPIANRREVRGRARRISPCSPGAACACRCGQPAPAPTEREPKELAWPRRLTRSATRWRSARTRSSSLSAASADETGHLSPLRLDDRGVKRIQLGVALQQQLHQAIVEAISSETRHYRRARAELQRGWHRFLGERARSEDLCRALQRSDDQHNAIYGLLLFVRLPNADARCHPTTEERPMPSRSCTRSPAPAPRVHHHHDCAWRKRGRRRLQPRSGQHRERGELAHRLDERRPAAAGRESPTQNAFGVLGASQPGHRNASAGLRRINRRRTETAWGWFRAADRRLRRDRHRHRRRRGSTRLHRHDPGVDGTASTAAALQRAETADAPAPALPPPQ
jgi:hypothetical protein